MKKKNGVTWFLAGIGMVLFFQSIINMEATASITLGTLLFAFVGWQLKQTQRVQYKKWLLPIIFSLSLILGACGTGSAITTESTSSSTNITKSSKTSESSTKDTTEISKEKAKKKELENLTKQAQQEVEKAEKEPTRDQLNIALTAIGKIPGGSSALTERTNKVEQTIVTAEKRQQKKNASLRKRPLKPNELLKNSESPKKKLRLKLNVSLKSRLQLKLNVLPMSRLQLKLSGSPMNKQNKLESLRNKPSLRKLQPSKIKTNKWFILLRILVENITIIPIVVG